jgi:microcystin-dependent protein
MYGSITPPAGFLNCDGSAISRSVYSALFSVIGITFGTGDGSTTFNLPAPANRNVRGVGGTAGLVVGQRGGNDTVRLDIVNLPAHSHGMTQNGANFTGGGTISSVQPNTINNQLFTGGDILTPGTTTVVTATGSLPQAFAVVNPYLCLSYIIKYV